MHTNGFKACPKNPGLYVISVSAPDVRNPVLIMLNKGLTVKYGSPVQALLSLSLF